MKFQKDHKKAATEKQFSLTDGIISKKKIDYRKYLKKDLKYLDTKQFSFFMLDRLYESFRRKPG